MTEMVAVDCPSGCGGECDCGKSRPVKKAWAQAHDVGYKLLHTQPLTLAERRTRERDRDELSSRQSALQKLSGKKDISENRGIGGAKVHLSQKERKSIERMIGVPVEDAQDARRKMKERGFRFIDKGELVDQQTRATIDWADADGEKRGLKRPAELEKFVGWDKLMGKTMDTSFDHAERLKYWKQQYGET